MKNHKSVFLIYKLCFKNYKYFVQFIHGMLLTLAFHPFNIFIVIPVAFSGFIFCLEQDFFKAKPIKLFKVGFIHGFVFFFGHFISSLYWIVIPLFTDIKKYWLLVPLAIFGVPGLLATFYGIASGIIGKFIFKKENSVTTNRISIAIIFAVGFFIAEILRSHLIMPFPWNLLGYATGYSLSLMQFASIVGVYGLSLLMYLVGTIPYTRNPIAILIITLTVFIITIYGRDKLHQTADKTNHQDIGELHIFQTNFNSTKTTNTSHQEELKHIDALLNSAEKSKLRNHLQFLILPESGIPSYVSTNTPLIFQKTMSQYHNNTFLISGIDRYDHISNEYFNSMIVVNNRGEIIDSYDKMILAPFGEYIPWSILFESIVGKNHGFTSGYREHNFKIYNKYSYDVIIIKPSICFESIFSPIIANDHITDIDLILNVTNDSWLGDSIGPHQHFAMTRMRAIEYGVPLVRVAKTGISAVFNSYGRVMRSVPLNKEAIMIIDIPQDKVETIYMKIIKFIKS